jgi:acetoin utilization deacetylase AcuC-like enzyme
LPALRNFEPQLIIISAGFDAHREDDLGQMGLVEDDCAWITKRLKEVAHEYANNRIVSCLEGGYNFIGFGSQCCGSRESTGGYLIRYK